MDVSIIIVNYNTEDHLRKCLDSIIEHTNDIEFEIIVVDNNSPNRAIEHLTSSYLTVKFHFRKVNDGFGAGCNYGTNLSKGKYLLFVNPDVVFNSDVAKIFVEFFESSPDAVMCSGLFEDEKGELIYSFNEFPNLLSDFRDAFRIGYSRHIKNLLTAERMKKRVPFEIDHPLGALMFLKRESFFEVNGFDERFFMYSEDVDIGYRLKESGKKIYCLPWVRVFHHYNSSVEGLEERTLQTFHLCRSKIMYMYKHYSFIQRTLSRLMMLIGMSLRLAYVPFNREYRSKRIHNFKRILRSIHVVFLRFNDNESTEKSKDISYLEKPPEKM